MQVRLKRGSAASGARSVRRLALFAGVPLIAAMALSLPDRALAACGPSHPAHPAATGTGVHTATSRPSSGGGGGGNLGCANGASAPLHAAGAPHGLSIASSGRVVEGTAHPAAHTATHARTATTKPANASAHLHGSKPPHA